MNCAYCGTALPEGALFCGECGRSVGTIVSAAAAPDVVATAAAELPAATPPAETPPVVQPDGDLCRQCGARMSPGDIFCGECGSVSHNVSEIFSPRGTGASQATHLAPEPDPEPAPEPAPASEPARAPELAPTHAPSRQTVPETRFLPRLIPPPRGVASVSTEDIALAADVAFAEDSAFDEDMESTRIVSRKRPGDRFVLQFSTGESVTVFGSGLIGRNPHAEPGEHFDHIVRLLDATRSVSKTHVEFGQEAGAFWIKDRYSGNGTVIREPDTAPLRCLPDRRHRLARGSRVDIGEQFFVVS
jgi:hypothetical protein